MARASALALLIAAVDIATKRLAERHLDDPVALVAGLGLELGHNSGIAFGALRDVPSRLVIALIALLIAGLLVAVWRRLLRLPWPATGLLLGGAAGNLVDRLDDGRVTDFIELPNWPAFNLADVAITLAVALILWRSARETEPARRREGRSRRRTRPT